MPINLSMTLFPGKADCRRSAPWLLNILRSVFASILVVLSLGTSSGCDSNDATEYTTQGSDIIKGAASDLSNSEESKFPFGKNEVNIDDDKPRIVAFGNSLTAGKGVSFQDTYPAQLQQRLDELGYRYQVINAGVSGETTAGGLRRVAWVLDLHPEIVILELGANDGLRGLSVQETYRNLEAIIQQFQSQHIKIILAGMNLPINYGNEYRDNFANIFQDLARQYGTPLIPFFLKGVAAHPQLNQPDGIHPTAEGYQQIVDHNILPILIPHLKKFTDPVVQE